MRAERNDHGLKVVFNVFETRLLRRVLQSVDDNYRLKPGELDPAVAAVWYSTRGCQNARMSAEEMEEWVQSLYSVKRTRLELLERCLGRLEARTNGRYELALTFDEAPALLAILNDHRLLLSARHNIGQEEMDLRALRDLARLDAGRRSALYEVHLLAYVMEELLRAMEEG